MSDMMFLILLSVDQARPPGSLSMLIARRVLEMARVGEIPAHAIGRKMWRFRLSELAEAIVAKKPAATARKSGIIVAGGSLAVPKGKGR
jgi:hypothetical protein